MNLNLYLSAMVLIGSMLIGCNSYGIDSKEFRFYDSNNNPIKINTNDSYLIILKNNKSCLNCFFIAEDYIQSLKADTINDWMIINSDSSTLERKRNIYDGKKLFNKTSFIGVTYDKVLTDCQTPEILLIKNGEYHLFTYPELFSDFNDEINKDVQDKIYKILSKP